MEWKETPIQLRACMYQMAMAETERDTELVLIPFVFTLTQTLTDRAKETEGGEASYLLNRLSKSLERALDRKPELWFGLEFKALEAGKGFAHIQGSILLYPYEVTNRKLARYGFYRINNMHKLNMDNPSYDELHKFKSSCLRFRHGKRKRLIEQRGQAATDLNWSSYNTKELATGRSEYTGEKRLISHTAATSGLKRHARGLYIELRALHKSQ